MSQARNALPRHSEISRRRIPLQRLRRNPSEVSATSRSARQCREHRSATRRLVTRTTPSPSPRNPPPHPPTASAKTPEAPPRSLRSCSTMSRIPIRHSATGNRSATLTESSETAAASSNAFAEPLRGLRDLSFLLRQCRGTPISNSADRQRARDASTGLPEIRRQYPPTGETPEAPRSLLVSLNKVGKTDQQRRSARRVPAKPPPYLQRLEVKPREISGISPSPGYNASRTPISNSATGNAHATPSPSPSKSAAAFLQTPRRSPRRPPWISSRLIRWARPISNRRLATRTRRLHRIPRNQPPHPATGRRNPRGPARSLRLAQ